MGFSSEDAVVVVVRRRRRRRIAFAAALVGAAILAAGWALTSFWGLLAGYLLVLTGAVLWVQLRTQPTALGAAAGQVSSVRVEDGALMVRSARWQTAVPLTRIAQGWTVEGRWGVRAFVDVREGDVFAVELATQREADALLDAAGVSLDRRVFTTRLAPPSQTGPVGCGRGGERVRVVSDATADADLRAALEAVAEDALTEELAARVLRRKV